MCQLLKNSCLTVSQCSTERVLATPKDFATQACSLSVGYSQMLKSQVFWQSAKRKRWVSCKSNKVCGGLKKIYDFWQNIWPDRNPVLKHLQIIYMLEHEYQIYFQHIFIWNGRTKSSQTATQLHEWLSFHWLQESKCNDDPFVRLQKLTIHLKELLSLHRNYNCRLSLAEYCDETTESLTYRMLDHVVAVELIPSTIEKVVRPYMQEHGLDEDKMMFQYIDVRSKPYILPLLLA